MVHLALPCYCKDRTRTSDNSQAPQPLQPLDLQIAGKGTNLLPPSTTGPYRNTDHQEVSGIPRARVWCLNLDGQSSTSASALLQHRISSERLESSPQFTIYLIALCEQPYEQLSQPQAVAQPRPLLSICLDDSSLCSPRPELFVLQIPTRHQHPPLRGGVRIIKKSWDLADTTTSNSSVPPSNSMLSSPRMSTEYRHMSSGSLNIPPPNTLNGNGAPPPPAAGMGRFEGPRSPPGRQSTLKIVSP